MRTYLLCFAVLLGCRDSVRLQKVEAPSICGTPCYTARGGGDIGECQSGVWACVNGDEATATCEGEVLPATEICDGLDNNCDGFIDERLSRSCSSACGTGRESCNAGVWAGCTAPLPQPEVCDRLDNDCDGQVDEADELPVEFCYDGPAESLAFGECRPGVKRCEFGTMTCYGQVTPKPEACNAKDDNCDGRVDEGLNPTALVDVVFAIDNSGSMGGVISAVKAAVSGFTTTYSNRPELEWALVTIPDRDPNLDGRVTLALNLTDPATFNREIQLQNSNGGGREPSIDAIYLVASPSNPLGINWRPGSNRHLVMFTDEEPQSYLSPEILPGDAAMAVQGSGLRVHVFAANSYSTAFGILGPPSLLDVQSLTGVPQIMQSALTALIREATCQ